MAFSNLFINIRAGTGDLAADMKKGASLVKGFEKQVGSAGISLKGALAGAVGGLTIAGIFKTSLDAYAEQELASKRLESTLAATEGAAKLSAKEIESFASALQDSTRFADETTIAAASVLATFNKISGAQFTRTLSIAADIATIKGLGLTEATTLVGKALQSPEEGLKKLKKVGIIFDDQMISTIKHMAEMGQTAEAQTVILDELNKRFGGAAQNDINTYTGAVERLKNAFGELQESGGSLVAPFLTTKANQAKDLMDTIRMLTGSLSEDDFLYGAGRGPNRNFHVPDAAEQAKALKGSQLRALLNPSGGIRAAGGNIKNAFATFFGAGGDHSVKGDKLFDEGKRVFDETRTPMEQFTERIKDLGKLFGANAINEDTFNRATRAELGKLHSGNDRLATAPEAGSQEAFATIARAQAGGGDGMEKEIIAQARKAAEDRRAMVDALKEGNRINKERAQLKVAGF